MIKQTAMYVHSMYTSLLHLLRRNGASINRTSAISFHLSLLFVFCVNLIIARSNIALKSLQYDKFQSFGNKNKTSAVLCFGAITISLRFLSFYCQTHITIVQIFVQSMN